MASRLLAVVMRGRNPYRVVRRVSRSSLALVICARDTSILVCISRRIAAYSGSGGDAVHGCGCSSGVEHNLAKVGVEGSNPFARSRTPPRRRQSGEIASFASGSFLDLGAMRRADLVTILVGTAAAMCVMCRSAQSPSNVLISTEIIAPPDAAFWPGTARDHSAAYAMNP